MTRHACPARAAGNHVGAGRVRPQLDRVGVGAGRGRER